MTRAGIWVACTKNPALEVGAIPLPVAAWSEEDIEWAKKAFQVPRTKGYTLGELIKDCLAERKMLWHFLGAVEGIFVTQLGRRPDGLELVIWGVAGQRVLRHFTDVMEIGRQYALLKNCKYYTCNTIGPGQARLYEQCGWPVVASVHTMELEHHDQV